MEQFQVLEDENLYQSNFKYFTVIFTFLKLNTYIIAWNNTEK